MIQSCGEMSHYLRALKSFFVNLCDPKTVRPILQAVAGASLPLKGTSGNFFASFVNLDFLIWKKEKLFYSLVYMKCSIINPQWLTQKSENINT